MKLTPDEQHLIRGFREAAQIDQKFLAKLTETLAVKENTRKQEALRNAQAQTGGAA